MRATSNYNLGKLHEELAKEWHPTKNEQLTPFVVTPGSGRKVWWRCEHGHEWEAVVASRTNGRDCPYCSGNRVGKDNKERGTGVKQAINQMQMPNKPSHLTIPYIILDDVVYYYLIPRHD